MYTDPSGYTWWSHFSGWCQENWKPISIGLAIVASVATAGLLAPAAGTLLTFEMATAIGCLSGMAGGFVGGFSGAFLQGASLGQSLAAGFMGGVAGGLTGAIYGIG